MIRIAVSGYASLDHVLSLDGLPVPGRTTTILSRPKDAWPRLGGSPAYVAAALARNGIEKASPITWVGDDAPGVDYTEGLKRLGVMVSGVASISGSHTPMAILAYEPQGGCLCLYHPAERAGLVLTDAHRKIIEETDWLCITVGPTEATREALHLLRDDARLCWVVKDDPKAMTAELAVELAARADLICCSAAEAAFVRAAFKAAGKSRPGHMIIETRGGEGAQVTVKNETVFVASESLPVIDPTGAGDTFAGGALAAFASGITDPVEIVQAGHRAAFALLKGRIENNNKGA